MALFSQDDPDEDETPSMGSAFSGGQDPQDPDAERGAPSPVEVDSEPLAAADNASTYAQSPDEQDSMLANPHPEDYPFPFQQDDSESGGQYAEPFGQPEPEHRWESVSPQDSGGGAAQIKAPVYGDHSEDRAALERQYAQEASQNVKPSIGRRILAGLAGGAVAFGGGNGAQTTQAVLDRPAAQAQAQWQRQERPLQQRLANDQAQDETAQHNYQNQRVAANDAALNEQRTERAQDFKAQADARANAIVQFTPRDPSNPYAGGSGVTASGKTVDNVAPPDAWLKNWERDPANKAKAQANAGVQTLQALEAAGVKLTPEQRAIVASGGKVTPSVHTTVSILENPDGSARPSGGGRGGQVPQGIQQLIAKNTQDKQAFIEQWQRQTDGSYTNPSTGATLTGPAFNARVEKFRTDLNANANMRKAGTWVDASGVTRGPGELGAAERSQAGPAQQPAPQQQPAAQQAAPQQPRTPAKGLPDNTAARNPKTGKVDWIVRGGQWVAQP